MAFYKLYVPKQAVGANLVYFDLFNVSTSGFTLNVWSVIPVVSGAVAVTGVVGVDLHLTKTSAVGTGGTAATAEGTDITAATFSSVDSSQPMDLTRVSARLTPTGGATAGALLGYRSVFSEETNAGTYVPVDLVNSPAQGFGAIVVRPGTGIRVIQGAVASVGNVGFDVLFSV
jgi:hypothetical protein